MDSSGAGFLRLIPGFGGSGQVPSDLSPRDKRFLAQVEKTLASFEALEEWADYIAFLSRLKKLLALPAEKPHSISWIPMSSQVLAKLSLCLSPRLPNGVHRKALELYEAIFDALDVSVLNKQISVWLPGILPVVSFGSMQVKPQVISLYGNNLLKHLTPQTLKDITKPLLLSLLCGLEDENSESFADVLLLIDSLKEKMGNNAHFWQNFFVCVISSPEKRLGALNWCVARLPSFAAINLTSEPKFSAEAQACLSNEPGLLIRAFAAALNTKSSFNQANDIIVMRGFFDLLLSHLPLISPVLTQVISEADQELLIMACCRVTLKKDMSLNRRLWKWLLGPDSGDESLNSEDHKAYFASNALPVLDRGLKALLTGEDPQGKPDAYNISLAMIMDRWEISQFITSRLFVPIIESSYTAVAMNHPRSSDLLAAAKKFFDEVETIHIWHYLIHDLILQRGQESGLPTIEFLVRNFDFPEDETNVHAPLAILAFLLKHLANVSTVPVLEILAELAHPNLLVPQSPVRDALKYSDDDLINSIRDFYSSLILGEHVLVPEVTTALPLLLTKNLEQWYIHSMPLGTLSEKMASLLADFLAPLPIEEGVKYFDETTLKTAFLGYPEFIWGVNQANDCQAFTIFGIVKLYRFLHHSFTFSEKSKMLKIIISNLWATLISLYPANYQVEAVRCIFDLRTEFKLNEIEAGLSFMLLQTPNRIRLHSFYKLWSLSQGFNESELLLSHPLFVVLDSLRDLGPENLIETQKFVYNVCTDGSANRFLKIVTGPLLSFSIVQKHTITVDPQDDFKLFAYHLETILNLLRSNDKFMKDSLAHEFVSSESSERFELFTSNGWDVSNYKTLLLNIIQKCLKLKLPETLSVDKNDISNFTACISKSLELYSALITGSEPDFVNQFDLLISSCLYYITESGIKGLELQALESIFIKHIGEFLDTAKSMNANILRHQKDDKSGSPTFIAFINRGVTNCNSPTLLEKWLSLMKSTLYLLDNSIFGEMLLFNQTIIEKIDKTFSSIRKYQGIDDCFDAESFLSICLAGIEDLLSITHSYLVTPSLGSVTKAQQGENGFFGNVILGVFQIESPLVKSEEEQRVYSVIIAFQDAIRATFSIWSWADGKPQVESQYSDFSSQQSITYMSNKLKFRSKKLLESLSELERQETIETLLETNKSTETKIKILHVLDSGHSQLSLPQILNSILTRCSPQSLTDKQKSTMYSSVTENRLCEFLIPYYTSIDSDTMDEIWDMSLSFFKEVSLHPTQFKPLLLTVLHVIKIVAFKARVRKFNDGKRNLRELTNYFLSILNAAVSKKAYMASPDKRPSSADKDVDAGAEHIEDLTSLVGSFGEIIQEQDRITTAVTTIISTVILTEAKPKAAVVPQSVLKLMLEIGKHYPIKPWKQVVLDTFVDGSFFQNEKYNVPEWKEIIGLWISRDKERMNELVSKITPPVQSSAANIFIWNENSEVEDRVMVLRRISYLILVQPKDYFVKNLEDIAERLSTALNSTCPALYKCEALMVFRALSLRFSEGHLLPYWSLVVQTLVEIFSDALAKNSKQFSAIETGELALILSACKLLDQLLLIEFDEVNLTSWLFVSRGSVTSDEYCNSLIDRLAAKSESLLTKEGPISVSAPGVNEKAKPLLYGISEVKNIAHLKKFFGLLGYINFERSYGLTEPDLISCEIDLMKDMGKH